MKTVIIPRGIPGSGKTTWTLEQLKLHKRGTAVRINNDDLSAMMFSSHWGDFFSDDDTRQMLHELRLNMLRTFLAQDHIEYIYVDNTNLAMKTVKALFDVASQADAKFVVHDEFLHIPVEVCIERDALRPRPVGEKVIRDMHKQASKIKPWNAPEIPAIMEYSNDYPGAEEVIICDIDGTLALMNGRGPYEFHKVDTDVPNYPVKNLIDTLRSEGVMRTVFLSGRGSMRARAKQQAITLPPTVTQRPGKPVTQARLTNLIAKNAERAETSGNRISAVLQKALELHSDNLPEITIELIKLRIANPSISITDLGQLMNPKMNKAQVSGRLRRAAELVD